MQFRILSSQIWAALKLNVSAGRKFFQDLLLRTTIQYLSCIRCWIQQLGPFSGHPYPRQLSQFRPCVTLGIHWSSCQFRSFGRDTSQLLLEHSFRHCQKEHKIVAFRYFGAPNFEAKIRPNQGVHHGILDTVPRISSWRLFLCAKILEVRPDFYLSANLLSFSDASLGKPWSHCWCFLATNPTFLAKDWIFRDKIWHVVHTSCCDLWFELCVPRKLQLLNDPSSATTSSNFGPILPQICLEGLLLRPKFSNL